MTLSKEAARISNIPYVIDAYLSEGKISWPDDDVYGRLRQKEA
jgi:hypothetical protein